MACSALVPEAYPARSSPQCHPRGRAGGPGTSPSVPGPGFSPRLRQLHNGCMEAQLSWSAMVSWSPRASEEQIGQ